MIHIILFLCHQIRRQNSWFRRLFVTFVEIIFVQASIPVLTISCLRLKWRQNKCPLNIFIDHARRQDKIVNFQVWSFED